MTKLIHVLLITTLFVGLSKTLHAQNNLPYPIIFLHGLTGNDETFKTSMEFYRDSYSLGAINVFDAVLNADDNTSNALMATDVKWTDFIYSGNFINIGRRNFKPNVADFVDGWTGSNLFAINFQEERVRGASGWWGNSFDESNEAAIYKQGYVLKYIIQEVLNYTGAEKVILIGHSMGGLCAREYLQRRTAGVPTNWIDPSSPDGHKVARFVTIGTPHLGSWAGIDPTRGNQNTIPSVTGNREALRDMKYEYDSYTNCGGTPKGIYMFGGNEHCIASIFWNATFDNVDINCDGDENDNIVGINVGTSFNPVLPLPTNIRYTWITNNSWQGEDAIALGGGWTTGDAGDGAVLLGRQWLYNGTTPAPAPLGTGEVVADTLYTINNHLQESSNYYELLRGADEPDRAKFAYKLSYNRPIIGFITHKSGLVAADADMYKVSTAGTVTVAITLDGALSGVTNISFCDKNEVVLNTRTVSTFPTKLYANVPVGMTEMYIKINGTAQNDAANKTWRHPYTLEVKSGSWVGGTSTNTELAANWLVGIPDQYDDVSVPATATYMPIVLSNGVMINKMYIENGASLTINPAASLELKSTCKLEGTIILKSDLVNTASFLDNGTITGTGKVTLQRRFKQGGYHYISAHVSDGNSSSFTDLSSGEINPNFYSYNENNSDPDWIEGWQEHNGSLAVGKGYAYFYPGNGSINFNLSGKPNTGNLSYGVSNSNFGITSDGWNLIGNPYPSGINIWDFLNANNAGTIVGAAYLWDDDYTQDFVSADYGTYNLAGSSYLPGTGGGKAFNGFLAAGQGFFVNAISNGSIDFSNTMRASNNSVFYKGANKNLIKRLHIGITGKTAQSSLLIASTDAATSGFDNMYDAPKLRISNTLALFSMLEKRELVIQSLQNEIEKEIIPIGIETANEENYTFKFYGVEQYPENLLMFFVDNQNQKIIDIKKENSYTTSIKEGLDKKRFELHFFDKDYYSTLSDIKVYAHSKNIYTQLLDFNNAYITVSSMNGSTVLSKPIYSLYSIHSLNNLNSGVYIVKITTSKETVIKKILLR